jgi:hypothetical protein
MQHGPVFGGVDGLTGPHRLDARAQIRRIGEAGQQAQAIVVDTLARKIEVQARGLARKTGTTFRICVAQRAQWDGAGFRGARLQGPPGGGHLVMDHGDGNLVPKQAGDGISQAVKKPLMQSTTYCSWDSASSG